MYVRVVLMRIVEFIFFNDILKIVNFIYENLIIFCINIGKYIIV